MRYYGLKYRDGINKAFDVSRSVSGYHYKDRIDSIDVAQEHICLRTSCSDVADLAEKQIEAVKNKTRDFVGAATQFYANVEKHLQQ